MSDRIVTTKDVPFKPAGVGLLITWRCMGCDTPRPALGARGAGIFKRCTHCQAKKAAK
jgi:hypothetical protein